MKISTVSLAELLAGANGARAELATPPMSQEMAARVLRDAQATWDAPCPFKVGDLVVPARHSSTWKASLGVCIVHRLLETPEVVCRSRESFFHLVCDVILIVRDDSGALSEIRAASRDFVRYEGTVA